ncbi:MAG: hypothetical protein F6K30_12160 [Cyanothece sp. SIO2G6]|nr:hypothetical protein [Cyanothece sp. SIO2G6]
MKTINQAVQVLPSLVNQHPAHLGYDFNQWTPRRLANHLANTHQIILNSRQIKTILAQYYRTLS